MPKKPQIAFFETADWEKTFLQSELKDYRTWFSSVELNPRELEAIREVEAVSVFIYSKLTADVLKMLTHLKLITTRSTGFDHIDLEYCRKKKITVCNVPTYGENTVAEHTFALILCLSRNVHEAYLRTIRMDFSMEGLTGFDLKGKTIGVVGTGHIGLRVIKIAKGFGMEVIAYDVQKNHFMAEFLGYNYVSLDELFTRADIITLHAPYNKSTHHMIRLENIKTLKKGVLLINTARGGLVQTEALVEGLNQGILGGVGLDVLEGEDMIKEEGQLLSRNYPVENLKTLLSNHILLQRDNVIITPHIGFNSKEALMRILKTTVFNIRSYYLGTPENKVGGKQ